MDYSQNAYNPNMNINKPQMNVPIKNYQNVSSPIRSHNPMNYGAQNFEQRMFPNSQQQQQQQHKPKFNPNPHYGNPFGQSNVNINQELFNQPKKTAEEDGEIEDIASIIYEQVETRFPDEAGKITGMIVDFGLDEMKHLIQQREKLDKVIIEAYEVKYF